MVAKFLFCLAVSGAPVVGQAPDPVDIVKRSVNVDQRHEELRRDYTYDLFIEVRELDAAGKQKSQKSTKVEVVALGAKRLRLLVERDGKPLPAADARKEKERYERAALEISRMSAADQQRELADEKRRSDEEREKFRHIPEAFKFTMVGETPINGRPAWEIRATPNRAYSGPYAFLLRNMEGTFWIDKADYAWVRIEADTLDTVSFGWIFARIQKGTRFTFESSKVNDELWAPSKIHFHGSARIALLKALRIDQDLIFSRYRKFQTDSHVVAIGEPAK